MASPLGLGGLRRWEGGAGHHLSEIEVRLRVGMSGFFLVWEMLKLCLGLLLSLSFSSRRRSGTGDAFLLACSHEAFVSEHCKNKNKTQQDSV